jgi:hypothetical protein
VWIFHHLLGGDRRAHRVGHRPQPPDLRQRVSGVFSDPQPQVDPAEEILRGRLARGEIDAEEYERCLRVLRG